MNNVDPPTKMQDTNAAYVIQEITHSALRVLFHQFKWGSKSRLFVHLPFCLCYCLFDLFRTTWMRWWGCAMTGWRVCSTSASSPSWQPVPSLLCCVPFPGHGDKLPAGQFVLCLPERPHFLILQPFLLYTAPCTAWANQYMCVRVNIFYSP